MKAFIINGARDKYEITHLVSDHLDKILQSYGWHVDVLNVHDLKIGPCRGCDGCGFKSPGQCGQKDDGEVIARLHAQCHLMALVSTVTFGGYSAMAKKAFERTMPNVHPYFMKYQGELHHRLRYPLHPRLLILGWQRERDDDSRRIFKHLAQRNALNFQAKHQVEVLTGQITPAELDHHLTQALRHLEVHS